MTATDVQAVKDRLRKVANQSNFWAQEFKADVQSLKDLGVAEDAIKNLYVELGVGQWLDLNVREKLEDEETCGECIFYSLVRGCTFAWPEGGKHEAYADDEACGWFQAKEPENTDDKEEIESLRKERDEAETAKAKDLEHTIMWRNRWSLAIEERDRTEAQIKELEDHILRMMHKEAK